MEKKPTKWKWQVKDDIVNFYNYKCRIEERLTDELGRPCYLVSSNEEADQPEEGGMQKQWTLLESEVMCSEDDYEGQDCENTLELTNTDRAELARQIAEGNTSGRLDSETEDGRGVYITWDLNTLKWTDL